MKYMLLIYGNEAAMQAARQAERPNTNQMMAAYGAYTEALKNPKLVRVAVNRAYVTADHRIAPGDEIGLFPPVTGG